MPDLWMDVDASLTEVPVNVMPLTDDTDFKTRETAVAHNAAGMDLVWNFVTAAGAMTQTAVTPTSGGAYDWTHQGKGYYTIEIPASGGASINNDSEGFGWFSGVATGVLPWRGPTIGFRAAGLNDALIEAAWSATRGLAGTALPAAAADAAGGLLVSDGGALDVDTLLARLDAAISTRLAAAGYTAPDNAGIGSNGTAIAANGAAIAALNNLSAQAVRDAMKLAPTAGSPAAGSVDQALDDLEDDTTQLLVDIAALQDLSVADILAGAYEGSETVQAFLRLARAALVGKSSGLDTTSAKFRDAADSKDRITATVDADGNRSAVTLDAS